ncbi:PD40 domain-containing protein [Chloroflexota bacterium]|nr:PD40 domain-containing protein [Chloroflexota bacterium]
MKKVLGICLFCLILVGCTSSQPTPDVNLTPTDPITISPSPEPTTAPTELPPTSTQGILPNQAPYYYVDYVLPGADPQPFGAEFFSGSFHSAPVFSPDMQTMWWAGSYGSATIYTSHFEDETWSEPVTVQFSDTLHQYRDPFISPDGQLFFFISPDPIPGLSGTGKENIWMMVKDGDGWSEPQPLPQSINALSLHWTISVDEAYTLYFSAGEQGNMDIYVSRYIDGTYADPVPLDPTVNSEAMEITPNIAPDGSYLIYSRYTSQDENALMYISYATDTGWTEPVQVNNVPYCISPIVTPDGAFVIYLSSPSSFGWRDTSFIEELRP